MWRLALAALVSSLALTACSDGEPGGIDIIDVSGPLDARALDFMADSIEDAASRGTDLVLVQLDSPAVLDGAGYDRLLDLMGSPPLPLAAWVGPAPAVAHGGAQILLEATEQRAMAPGTTFGVTNPVVLGEAREELIGPNEPEPAENWDLMELQPTLRQFLQALDGRVFETNDGPVTVKTLVPFADGVTLKTVTFRQPGLIDRFFRLGVAPEAAFFFVVVGLTVLTFEFYALGPGVAAGAAGLSLLIGGWGMIQLPTRWWALTLLLAGWGMLTWAYQRGGSLVTTLGGAVALQLAGMTLIDGARQIDPRWWLVLPSVLAVLFFYLLAMPTVQRARLSTVTLGRDHLIGHTGRALDDFDPDGIVEVEGARWRATAHREAGVTAGSPVVVRGVDGLYLEVEPLSSQRET